MKPRRYKSKKNRPQETPNLIPLLKTAAVNLITRYAYELILLCTWGAYFAVLFAHMVAIRPDGLYVGHENVWSDWASLHLGMANIFAYKPVEFWFAYTPVFANGKLTYAFLTNLISALLIRSGLSVPDAFIYPSIVFSIVLIFAMMRTYQQMLGSKALALIAISLFFLSSGLGFIHVLDMALHTPGYINTFAVRDINTLQSHDWMEGNFIIGQLLPQRAFLIGMPLALLGMLGIFYSFNHERYRKTVLVGSGVCIGILPVAHMHSLIALVVIMLPVAAVSLARWRQLLYFFVPASTTSITLYLSFIHGGIQSSNFMQILPGISSHGLIDWFTFWWKAWGPTIPLAIAGACLLWRSASREIRALYVGFFLLFCVANIVLFQPTRWDNSKMFLWCYFGFAGMAAHALSRFWAMGRIGMTGALALGCVLTATGIIEVVDLQNVNRHTWRLLSTEEMVLAEEIRDKTDPLARFATAFTHDHPVSVWAARPVMLGYRSWVENFGLKYKDVEQDVTNIYLGQADTPQLLKKNNISYVYFGPAELREMHPNEGYFRQRFPVSFSTKSGSVRVYDVRSVSGGL
jgi:hypothetical protein